MRDLYALFPRPSAAKEPASYLAVRNIRCSSKMANTLSYPESVFLTFASQSLHAISFALYHTAAIAYVFSLYTQKKLAQQFLLGIAFGLGGSVGAVLSGQIYGEYLFLIESFIALMAFAILFVHQKRKESIAA